MAKFGNVSAYPLDPKEPEEFMIPRPGRRPWVILEGKGGRLNPDRPDFHPQAQSKRFADRGGPKHFAPKDLEGRTRKGPSMGILAPAASEPR